MTRAAIYCRVSTADQVDGTSLDAQKARCRAAATQRGWQVVSEYVDEGISGTKADRPQWRAMLRDAQARKVDAVVVLKLDRFGRNAGHAIAEIDRLTDLGVAFVSVAESIDLSTPVGKMLRTTLAGFAEFERDMITERGVSGQRAKAAQGRWPGGEPPFGWRLEGKGRDARPVPDQREREVVGRVARWLVEDGLSSGEVADRLNAAGLYPRKAARWSYENVRRVFTNETLTDGVVTWGQVNGRRVGHHAKMRSDGTPRYGEPIEVRLADPPLTRERWEAVQRALARQPRATAVPARAHPLSGRLVGQCGNHYNGVTLSHTGRVVYRCHGRRHRSAEHPKCDCPQLDGATVEAAVWGQVVALLGDPDRLVSMARQWLRVSDGDDQATDDELAARVGQQVARLERARDRAAKEMLLADDPEPLRRALAEVERDLREARERQAALESLRVDAADRARRLTDLAALADRAAQRLVSMSPAQQREVLALLDVRVSVASAQAGREPLLTIEGKVDPRLFDGGSGGGGREPGTPPAGDDDPGRLPRAASDRPVRHLPRAGCAVP